MDKTTANTHSLPFCLMCASPSVRQKTAGATTTASTVTAQTLTLTHAHTRRHIANLSEHTYIMYILIGHTHTHTHKYTRVYNLQRSAVRGSRRSQARHRGSSTPKNVSLRLRRQSAAVLGQNGLGEVAVVSVVLHQRWLLHCRLAGGDGVLVICMYVCMYVCIWTCACTCACNHVLLLFISFGLVCGRDLWMCVC
jgi:hypothetical protein